LQGIGGDGFQQGDGLALGQRRGRVLLHAGGLDGGDVLGGLPGDEPLGRELLVGTAEHGQAARDRGGGHARFMQGSLVHLHVVGCDFQRGDALGLHVADEVQEIAAVGFDGVIRQQGIADPGDQRGGGLIGGAAAGLQGPGQEGGDLVGGRCVAVEEVAALPAPGEGGVAAG